MKSPVFVTIATALLATVSACTVHVTPAELRRVGLQPARERARTIDFALEDLSGRERKLSDFRGKVVFLNFWATWCAPCRAEMPSMQTLYERLKDRGFEIVAVDLREGPNLVEPFVTDGGLTFPVLLDRSGKVGGRYGVRSLPTTYVIGRDGTILAGRIGGQEWDGDQVVEFFEGLLER